ncbi:MAG: response regulator transcription factor [Candidatus Omnitrophica bacterium]|nr:response regulator transcription factor [Candidatus Omnitrophota bacterium]
MRILIVEDEIKVCHFIERGLKEHGITVDTALDGHEGYVLAETGDYDCIILDIMLPKLDGYEVVKRLREKKIKTPVIFLTAKDAVEDRVQGLELGADDYLVKPFAFSELLARVRARVRRERNQEVNKYQIGDLMIDVAKRVVTRSGQKIDLTPREFSLLQYLAEKQSEVVTRTMISEHVWGYHFDSMSNVIDVHMTNLRKKVDLPDCKPLIHTLRGIGYVLEHRS